ncbi:intermembrane lipid transfer protein Vps13D isoform X2 [Onthophagus taurus]|uniref:intermembrane lipid transfer protein Vps13D isoform X2 n=1 Tax=Onthophagus taurus TaxID=166361 RepID=UPI000C1FFBD5|nr:vacuolar protein sorting-associated protein 13D isoform X2 [Onthophagus taurus]
MLEGLAAWVLNNYLGKYVENLNTDQLSIALLSGQVELENLPLKKDALRHLGLPIEIKSGFIGKVKLQIPVRLIKSAPWVIQIEQLYVVASPLPVQEWDSVAEKLASQELKLSALDNFEAKWRLETESKDQSTYYASTYSSWLSYGTGVITNIIDNLQLKIKDVHIRYEDNVSLNNKAAAFGVTMETLSAQSSDGWTTQWDSATSSFKLLEMQKLAVYWIDLDLDKVFSKMSPAELALAMSPGQDHIYGNHYILSPVSAQARIQRNRSEKPLRSIDTPRITCDLQLDEVPLTLIDWQYEQIVKCTRGLDDIARLRSYREYRPNCSVSEDAHAWWVYAISCMYPGGQPNICKPHPTWESCLERAKENVAYTKLYKKILVTPTITLTVEEKKVKDNVEWIRDVEEIKILREIAMKSVPSQPQSTNQNSAAGRGVLVRWFPQWMGWYSSAQVETTQSNEATQLEGEILKALSDSFDDNTILKRDVVFGKFSFSLKSGLISLCSTKDNSRESIPMIELEFKNLSLNITSKPRSTSHIVELCLGGMYLKDKITSNTIFPTLIGPPSQERSSMIRSRGPSPRVSLMSSNEDLFSLVYEKCPINSGYDYKLSVKTKSLDVVYQPAAIKWLLEFLFNPHQRIITHSRIEAMKSRTKKGLIKNWEQMLDGRVLVRKIWDLQLDISAPQIFFIEKFNDQNSSMAVIDFGRFLVNNKPQDVVIPEIVTKELVTKESEDDDMFVTPCSTPPVSEESDSASPNTLNAVEYADILNESTLHDKIYDRYNVELTDMQILIGKVKDNWRYAHNKGSSTMHVLDRFNISLQLERRVVHTTDPSFPSLTLNANLPKLVAHLNENKISAARTLMQIITTTGLPSPFNINDNSMEEFIDVHDDDESESVDTSVELSRLLMVQFTIDHMALEVQSRGRSVAELQVTGVKVAFTKRPVDIGITLTVHGLLLVDALQTFGPDFELLVASHKHVGMDSMSGSLRDSEPTSPMSPGSPDPNAYRPQTTSPVALSQALSSLATSPPLHQVLHMTHHRVGNFLDAEALISIEITLITGAESMQFANIQFNNLDIIANQETIVELMGFIRRVFPDMKSQKQQPMNIATAFTSMQNSSESILEDSSKMSRTELAFDFHRLNVLLLRGVYKDGSVQGKKICTATLSEAKIQTTVDNGITIEGSLGGLQVLDLTPEGHMHQRIVSVGHDPVLDLVHPLYVMSQSIQGEERKALNFKIIRSLHCSREGDEAEIIVRMASLWYTHSPQFLKELQSCATEFKQYLSHLAKSIKSAATDMALGLVHARLSASIYGSALSFSDFASPRRRRRSSSMEQTYSGYSSVRDTMPQTPYSPEEDSEFMINIKLDVVLDSPVIIIPRSSNSPQVFIGHLGKITLTNNKPGDEHSDDLQDVRQENYDIEVRDMNIYSLDTTSRRVPGPLMSRPEVVYSCETLAKPMLHDTILQLNILREIVKTKPSRQESNSNLLLDDDNLTDESLESDATNISESIMITGSIITALKVSMARYQYEQLIDTITWLMRPQTISEGVDVTDSILRPSTTLTDIREEDTGVPTLKMDPHVRAKLFPNMTMPRNQQAVTNKRLIAVKVQFGIPNFIVELRGDTHTGEQGLVDLSFREFLFIYEKFHLYETNIQVSLRSILMEDLLQPEGSKQRAMVVSSAGDELPVGLNCISRSCPDITDSLYISNPVRGSLPSDLQHSRILGVKSKNVNMPKTNPEYPSTPPPSPSVRDRPHKNLALISTLLVDPSAPNFKSYYNSLERSTSIDFNCLDLVVSVESWVLVIDFFSASSPETVSVENIVQRQSSPEVIKESTTHCAETNISVRSLTVVLVRPDRDIARANISHLDLSVKNIGLRKEVEGKLGSISLFDLTLHGQLYRERFLTSGKQVLNFHYVRYAPSEIEQYECQLKLDMSSIFYVHTKRFVAEVSAFFNYFTKLQAVMAGIRAATSGQKMEDDKSRLSLIIKADSPVILLPVSSKSADLLICDLGQLAISNDFKLSNDVGCISIPKDPQKGKCLLNVMYLELQNVNLHTGKREIDCSSSNERLNYGDYFKLGSCTVRKHGTPILTKACHLKLQVERNLDCLICHNVPDMSIHGELSTLDGTLNDYQYKLIRGLLTYNIGENTEHILPSVEPPPMTAEVNIRENWKLSSIRLDLLNVNIRLINQGPLACINFIKSRLTIDSFSNMSQDIDLVSQEILIRDSRFEDAPVNKRSNVFTNILQPIKTSKDSKIVQVEVHSRKRLDKSESTILLNNMRLMAVFDWWEAAKEFIFQDISNMQGSPAHEKLIVKTSKNDDNNFEFKLNVTDSELVVVEDTSQWDTNAVILKSTTVISYRPAIIEKPMSCNLNNCEMYSCILGMEDETALSIIDPVTLNIEVNADKVLEVHLQRLIVRLSYYDMRMFLQILNSLPKQMFSNKKEVEEPPANIQTQIRKLTALGFTIEDCMHALEYCDQKLDDAALWLTQNAVPSSAHDIDVTSEAGKASNISAVEVKADCISLCIIDDCGDADVPLLELALSRLNLRQGLVPSVSFDGGNDSQGAMECMLTGDYYNRVLSGWEPVIEPWKCLLIWNRNLSPNISNLLQMTVESKEVLNINISSTLTDLYRQVKTNWMQDFYNNKDPHQTGSKPMSSPPGYKRRCPFIPFAIKNDTGSALNFTTLISDINELYGRKGSKNIEERWIPVPNGETVTFRFRSSGKIRHSDTHVMRMHRLGVQVDGYQPVTPVTVDKVGVYFRNSVPAIQPRIQQAVPPARIVFDISIEGSARKLITVRSALLIVNKLKEDMEVKLESNLATDLLGSQWTPSRLLIIKSGQTIPVPLMHAHSSITARPIMLTQMSTFSTPYISWELFNKYGEIAYELRVCHSSKGKIYRFCAEITRENYPLDRPGAYAGATCQNIQPAHTITLLPTVLVVNLLPVDISFKMCGTSGRVRCGSQSSVTFIDPEELIEMYLYLENFPNSNALIIPPNCTGATYRVKLEDSLRRRLNLTVTVTPNNDAKLKITVSVGYWIINKTGLPLVFRQGGVTAEAAGQFREHESARMVQPLLFSFSDPDASLTVMARVGCNVILDGAPQWSSNFHLQKGCQVRKLRVSHKDGRPDTVFIIGIEIRIGRGKYRDTSIVIISPRFQLYNRTSYQLLFAQNCEAVDCSKLDDPKVSRPIRTHLKAMPECHMPFHWTRFDKDQLLCVMIVDVSDCWWSGGLKIDQNDSLHVNIRDSGGRMYFLRLEVVLQGATYFAVFTDADTMPPPLRIDNFSEVSITFAQTCCKEIVHSVARAHSSIPYAWDKPREPHNITLEAPGGVIHTYNMNILGPSASLTYENFIYIAFTGTFKRSNGAVDPLDVESQELVLDVVNKTDVILARKQQGQRSQLWRMTSLGQLQHEGSSPPSDPLQPKSGNIYVLDIEGPAPQPSCYTRLCLRRTDPRRKSTQTWRFTEEGRLCCAHNNMCVQAQDGFFGLRQGNSAVLGLPQPVCHRTMQNGVPLEQAVSRQRMRPGSGFLDVEISTDGPTKVLSISDKKDQRHKFAVSDEGDWSSIAPKQRPGVVKTSEDIEKKESKEFRLTVKLAGLGISLISRKPPEELLFTKFSKIVSEILFMDTKKRFCISVEDIQIDNQLLDASTPVVLHVTRTNSRMHGDLNLPTLDVVAEMLPILNENAVIFKHFIVKMNKLTVYLEERLLLKIFAFIGFDNKEEDLHNIDETDYETQRMLTDVSAAHSTRYYFETIQLIPNQIRLSMRTANKLSYKLQGVKRKLGLTFIKFEDAAVDLEPFKRDHSFETLQFLINVIMKHFKDELKWQAAVILGSVDFLGNPLGLVSDVSEGVNGFIREGNVGALVTNIAHGLSNSAAKVTESLSDGLGFVAMDEEHEEMRQRIRQVDSGRSRDHIYAGIKGLGFGVLGGATGIFKQVYEGAVNEGVQGVFSGIGKGLLGAVAKPVVGVLDLASETARAVRDSSRGSSRSTPDRLRPPRCVFGTGGLLPRYSYKHAIGQQYLYAVNNRNYSEQLVAYDSLLPGVEDLHIIISTQRVRIITNKTKTVIEWHLSDLRECRTLKEEENKHYIQIMMHVTGGSTDLVYQDPIKKPKVRCESAELASVVSQQINYAKRLFDERLHTVQTDNITNCED